MVEAEESSTRNNAGDGSIAEDLARGVDAATRHTTQRHHRPTVRRQPTEMGADRRTAPKPTTSASDATETTTKEITADARQRTIVTTATRTPGTSPGTAPIHDEPKGDAVAEACEDGCTMARTNTIDFLF